MLCYPCVAYKSELEKSGWKDGQPHPDDCTRRRDIGATTSPEGN